MKKNKECCEKCKKFCDGQCPKCGYYCTCGLKDIDCPCHQEPKKEPQGESWEERFENKFTHQGIWGEKRLSVMRVNKNSSDSPISLDDQIIDDLKDFIRWEIQMSEVKARQDEVKYLISYKEKLREKIEKLYGFYEEKGGKYNADKSTILALLDETND